jgi:hypothetical protein
MEPGFTGDATIAAVRDHLATRLGDDVVILGLRDSVYYGLNGVGARVWELVQTPCTRADLVRTIVSEYEVSAETAAADLDALLAELHARGLIAILPPGDSKEPRA